MSAVSAFKLVLISLIAIIALELLAKRLRLPPAAALLVGGAAMAFAPGLPPVNLDPDLVLILFLPPLLMDGAYYFVWDDFKRHLSGILLLAIGAVAFTTFFGRRGRASRGTGAAVGRLLRARRGGVATGRGRRQGRAGTRRAAAPADGAAGRRKSAQRRGRPRAVPLRRRGGAHGRIQRAARVAEFHDLALGGIAVGLVVGFIVVRLLRCAR